VATADLLEDGFPHGTIEGYAGGCRGASCPAPISCRDFHRRYCGDFAFRRAVNAGFTAQDVLDRDRQRVVDTPAHASYRQARPKPRTRSLDAPPPDQEAPALIGPSSSGLDGPSAASLAPGCIEGPDASGELAAFRVPTELAVSRPQSTRSRIDHQPELRRLHSQGKTDSEIAAAIGLPRSRVGNIRRALNLPANRNPETRNVNHQEHGTNATYTRGCRCELCVQARRTYSRQYMAKRKASGTIGDHHGTAYGYQLGCRDGATCPVQPTCIEASRAEDERRRRSRGASMRPVRVDATPVRAHVLALLAAGMTIRAISNSARVSRSSVKNVIYGHAGSRTGLYLKEIAEESATKLLAIEVSDR